MPDWPSGLQGSLLDALALVTLTASSTVNTKGSYVEITSSTPIDADGFYLHVRPQVVGEYLLDVAIGAAGSEVVVIENLLVHGNVMSGPNPVEEVYVPMPIKAGQRLAARCQSTDGSAELFVSGHLSAGGFFSSMRLGHATTYGANAADSGGVQIDPGATVNTKSAWSEISSSLTSPVTYAIVCFGAQNNGAMQNAQWKIDLGVGAAGSEVVVVPDLLMYANASEELTPYLFTRAVSIKAGQRLAARAACSIFDATDRLIDVVVIGIV